MMTLTYISGTITPKAMVQECPYIIVYSHIWKYQGRCYKKGSQTNDTVTSSQVLEQHRCKMGDNSFYSLHEAIIIFIYLI